MTEKYTIGLDFGTLSARALLVRISDGKELGYTEFKYPHGVMNKQLPNGKNLKPHWALQHPQDYLDALRYCTNELIRKYSVDTDDILGICIDFTACTMLPVKYDSTPLCFLSEYEDQPLSYVTLWKHHAAQYCADIINEKAENQNFLKYFGGKISSEFYFPKLLQVAIESPEIFNDADLFIEAGDWIVWKLTGKLCRSASFAVYKAFWNPESGYPKKEFLDSLYPNFGDKALKLLNGKILLPGSFAGKIAKEASEITGLSQSTSVCTAVIDAHSALPAAKIKENSDMIMIMGTSGCHIALSKELKNIDGILAFAKDGIIPGYYAYESGQTGFGDHFEWMMKNIIPPNLFAQAEKQGVHVLDLLSDLASKQSPGSHGLLALDWFNGNRSVLSNSDLNGMLLGLTLNTKTEDIYRALVEAIAFGTRKIIENYENSGLTIKNLHACGSLSKNKFIMQVFSDVLNKEIKIAASENASALGSAIYAAASSSDLDFNEAIDRLGKLKDTSYIPINENVEIYNKLYNEYSRLHDYFGRGENNVMKTLFELKKIKSNKNNI